MLLAFTGYSRTIQFLYYKSGTMCNVKSSRFLFFPFSHYSIFISSLLNFHQERDIITGKSSPTGGALWSHGTTVCSYESFIILDLGVAKNKKGVKWYIIKPSMYSERETDRYWEGDSKFLADGSAQREQRDASNSCTICFLNCSDAVNIIRFNFFYRLGIFPHSDFSWM